MQKKVTRNGVGFGNLKFSHLNGEATTRIWFVDRALGGFHELTTVTFCYLLSSTGLLLKILLPSPVLLEVLQHLESSGFEP